MDLHKFLASHICQCSFLHTTYISRNPCIYTFQQSQLSPHQPVSYLHNMLQLTRKALLCPCHSHLKLLGTWRRENCVKDFSNTKNSLCYSCAFWLLHSCWVQPSRCNVSSCRHRQRLSLPIILIWQVDFWYQLFCYWSGRVPWRDNVRASRLSQHKCC